MSTKWRVLAVATGLMSLITCKQSQPVTGTSASTETTTTNTMAAMKMDLLPRAEYRVRQVTDEQMATVVRRARDAVKGVDPDQDPVRYVTDFEAALRPQLAQLTGREIAESPLDSREMSKPMYESYSKIIKHFEDTASFGGDEKKGAERAEVFSLISKKEQCSAVAIATNAIATARHCMEDVAKFIRNGQNAGSGTDVKIDPSKFVALKDESGAELDMAILVTDQPITTVPNASFPVFASTAMIDDAEEWQIVGYGGDGDVLTSDGFVPKDGGIKRLGVVPKLYNDCSPAAVAATYKCSQGLEIVAGARPLVAANSCPLAGASAGQQGACQGDSGGAVYLEKNGKLFLAGLIRHIDDRAQCGCKHATNLYVRFDKQLKQIKNMAGIKFTAAALSEVGNL